MTKVRTLNQLIERIAVRTKRLEHLKAVHKVPPAVVALEEQVIASLQGQYDKRVAFVLQCLTFNTSIPSCKNILC